MWGIPQLDENPDVDIYVAYGTELPFIDFLRGQEGLLAQTLPPSRNIHTVHQLERVILAADGTSIDHIDRVDIVVSEDSASESSSTLTAFHSTVVMNWISADSVSSAYAYLTFRQRGTTNCNSDCDSSGRSGDALRKYMKRGSKFCHDPSPWLGTHSCGLRLLCCLTMRSSRDRGVTSASFGGFCLLNAVPPDSRNLNVPKIAWFLGGNLCKKGLKTVLFLPFSVPVCPFALVSHHNRG